MYRRYASLFFLVGVDAEEVRFFSRCARQRRGFLERVVFPSSVVTLPSLLTCTSDAGDDAQNELAILEFIHCIVETLDRFFANVCELDIMFHIEKVRDTQAMPRDESRLIRLGACSSQARHSDCRNTRR